MIRAQKKAHSICAPNRQHGSCDVGERIRGALAKFNGEDIESEEIGNCRNPLKASWKKPCDVGKRISIALARYHGEDVESDENGNCEKPLRNSRKKPCEVGKRINRALARHYGEDVESDENGNCEEPLKASRKKQCDVGKRISRALARYHGENIKSDENDCFEEHLKISRQKSCGFAERVNAAIARFKISYPMFNKESKKRDESSAAPKREMNNMERNDIENTNVSRQTPVPCNIKSESRIRIPRKGLIGLKSVLKVVNMSKSSWYKCVRMGIAPAPKKILGMARWDAEEIWRWIANS